MEHPSVNLGLGLLRGSVCHTFKVALDTIVREVRFRAATEDVSLADSCFALKLNDTFHTGCERPKILQRQHEERPIPWGQRTRYSPSFLQAASRRGIGESDWNRLDHWTARSRYSTKPDNKPTSGRHVVRLPTELEHQQWLPSGHILLLRS